MSDLYRRLLQYDREDVYPFHMPGHKRNPSVMKEIFPASIDITEITGFDNLHHAEGILLEAQHSAAELYQVKSSYFGVNGSTGMILSAISACVRRGGKLLMARNSHRSAYHAVCLRGLRPVYVYPERPGDMPVNGSVDPKTVERLLEENPDAEAVYITSPTYDGVVSDVRSIAEAAHKRGIPLIVDEAHGAHMAFSDCFPESAARCGADIVIHSVHKTLPCLTQTSLLHVCSDRIDSGTLHRFLSIYQSSSPSYILMSSIDACVESLRQNKEEWFGRYTELLERTRERLRKNGMFPLIEPEKEHPESVWACDRSKILISTGNSGLCGQALFELLRDPYRIELEMSAPAYVLALSSVGDTEEGMDRLVRSLEDIGKRPELQKKPEDGKKEDPEGTDGFSAPEQVVTLSEAMEGKTKTVPLFESAGCVSAEFIMVYPPGIPLITPGERITGQLLASVRRYIEQGLTVTGLKDRSYQRIEISEM